MRLRMEKITSTKQLKLNWMRSKVSGTWGWVRSSYDEILTGLFDVFGRDGCYVDICETMFDDAIATRLGRFLASNGRRRWWIG